MGKSCLHQNQDMKPQQKESKIKKKRYLIDKTNNFQYYASLRMLVSQPIKYLLVHVVIICGMIYFYVLSFVTKLIIIEINYAIVALHILNFIFHVLLGFKNPGIILKISEDFQSKTKIHIPFDRDSKPALNQMAKQYVFPIKSHRINLRFCPECLIYKPPRTVHCYVCNACIEKMDHHCPYIGNCVGKGNYRIFFCFITTLGCMVIMIMIQLIILVVKLFEDLKEDAFKKPQLYFAVSLFIFALLVLIFVMSLGCFHIYLIINSTTTNQLCRKTWNSVSGNPFKKNFCLKNFFRFITGPSNEKVSDPAEQLQKSMIPRFKDKSEEYLSSQYNSQPPSSLRKSQTKPQRHQQTIQKDASNTHQQILTKSIKAQI